jgi:predicted NAD/FAD-binding protein
MTRLYQIVCNPPTYPNFLAFLSHLGIPTNQTEMTFSVSRDGGLFEWAGKGLSSVFCQTRNLCVPPALFSHALRRILLILFFICLC